MKLGIPMAIIDKRRVSDTAVKQGHVVGEVAGRDVVIFEDEIATAGTLVSSVATLKAAGARTVHAAATHGVLCGPAIERLRDAAIDSIVVTNTVNLPAEKRLDKLTVLNVAQLFAAAIECIHSGQSVGVLFESGRSRRLARAQLSTKSASGCGAGGGTSPSNSRRLASMPATGVDVGCH